VDAGLVVVGNRGYGRFEELFAGTVSVPVAAHAATPVMVVRQPGRDPAGARLPVVVGLDGSTAAEAALRFAADEARLRGVPLVAVYSTVDVPVLVGAPAPDPLPMPAVEAAGLSVRRHITHADPRTALVAASERSALVVVGSRGHGPLTGMLLGSVGQTLIHSAHCPVAVVHGSY
jgi:nucleotide-binding universal stress UspA family protein